MGTEVQSKWHDTVREWFFENDFEPENLIGIEEGELPPTDGPTDGGGF